MGRSTAPSAHRSTTPRETIRDVLRVGPPRRGPSAVTTARPLIPSARSQVEAVLQLIARRRECPITHRRQQRGVATWSSAAPRRRRLEPAAFRMVRSLSKRIDRRWAGWPPPECAAERTTAPARARTEGERQRRSPGWPQQADRGCSEGDEARPAPGSAARSGLRAGARRSRPCRAAARRPRPLRRERRERLTWRDRLEVSTVDGCGRTSGLPRR